MEQLYFFNSKRKKDSLSSVFMVSIEKICVAALVVLVLWVAAFYLGYKKGFKSAEKKGEQSQLALADTEIEVEETAFDLPQDTTQEVVARIQENTEEKIVVVKNESQVKPPVAETRIPLYSIQLASYTNIRVAEWHLEKLKKEGLDSFIEKKGAYDVLYVGKFSSKVEAQKIIGSMKKRFPDCLIRRL